MNIEKQKRVPFFAHSPPLGNSWICLCSFSPDGEFLFQMDVPRILPALPNVMPLQGDRKEKYKEDVRKYPQQTHRGMLFV